MTGPYDDILHMAYPWESTRPRMSAADRAGQFSPFAALVGYEASIAETARLTGPKIELTDSAKEDLNETLQRLSCDLKDRPFVKVTYFQPDLYKEGGSYLTVTSRAFRIDPVYHYLFLEADILPMDSILKIEYPPEP